ncbi:DUF6542 domain-containing protein [Mycolicibacter algericus]|uniref:DUF6542 domain-containing protein n=2 Tax=Mycolicibacter algericus TaxID=1288388 RepID=A0A7I9Y5C4_MYCAL|nr:DUF6542 domain-containing protein [Mycolicibacter algericus]OQZ94876.1 hypothetical protein BST10_17275 [Mycolicibacter algericus DSM 45454]GFG83876.1 hypothetical protein MALGJ_05520 [Mycolicibacter algericus]
MAAQRQTSAVAADHRSILPNAAGFPWWGAVAVAVVATAVGVAFDAGSGDKELSIVFSALYAMGCIAAVLTVRQSAVFTAVVQPPLILFGTVPAAYWLFRGGGFPGVKAILINCGYPLIERFPLMLFTAAAVLLLGMVRWYLGMLSGATTPASDDGAPRRRPALVEKLSALLTAALSRDAAHAIEPPAARGPRERRPGDRPRRATPEARRAARKTAAGRPAARSGERRRGANGAVPSRSRHVRPPMDDVPATERPRRRRPAPDEPLPRRRPAPDWQDAPPRRRPEPRSRADRDPRARGYRPAEAPESLPRRRQPPPTGRGNGADSTHHPVSRVRYRTGGGDDSGREPRTRSRQPRTGEFDSWEYDI